MSSNGLDSRGALAAEIADSVRRELRAKHSAENLSVAIEKNLVDEARRAELKLAYLRVAAAGVFAVFVIGRLLISKVASVPPPTIGSLTASLIWMTFAVTVLGLLRREWYRSWLRRGFPLSLIHI